MICINVKLSIFSAAFLLLLNPLLPKEQICFLETRGQGVVATHLNFKKWWLLMSYLDKTDEQRGRERERGK